MLIDIYKILEISNLKVEKDNSIWQFKLFSEISFYFKAYYQFIRKKKIIQIILSLVKIFTFYDSDGIY